MRIGRDVKQCPARQEREHNHATTIIKARALKRMAELVDEGQERGEIASRGIYHGNQWSVPEQDISPATLDDLGITRQKLHEARKEWLREN